MKIRAIFISLGLFFILSGAAYSASLEDGRFEFRQGNTSYSAGEYEQAITHYEKVLSSGFESSPLYYNLANAYFKNGFLGKAVLNYIRAQRITPKDADLISNLAYARSRIGGGEASIKRSFLVSAFLSLADLFSLDGITVISFILYLILSIFIILMILLKEKRKVFVYISIPLAVLLAISASIFMVQFNRIAVQKEAVVVAKAADSKFEPADEATTFFSLGEGENILVVATKPGWLKVKRLDGKQGWVKEADLKLI